MVVKYLYISWVACFILLAWKNVLTFQAPIFKGLWGAAERRFNIWASCWIWSRPFIQDIYILVSIISTLHTRYLYLGLYHLDPGTLFNLSPFLQLVVLCAWLGCCPNLLNLQQLPSTTRWLGTLGRSFSFYDKLVRNIGTICLLLGQAGSEQWKDLPHSTQAGMEHWDDLSHRTATQVPAYTHDDWRTVCIWFRRLIKHWIPSLLMCKQEKRWEILVSSGSQNNSQKHFYHLFFLQ